MRGPAKTAEYPERRRSESIIENLPDWALKQLDQDLSEQIAIVQREIKIDREQVRRLKNRRDRVRVESRKRRGEKR
jgi:hypothetical protein